VNGSAVSTGDEHPKNRIQGIAAQLEHHAAAALWEEIQFAPLLVHFLAHSELNEGHRMQAIAADIHRVNVMVDDFYDVRSTVVLDDVASAGNKLTLMEYGAGILVDTTSFDNLSIVVPRDEVVNRTDNHFRVDFHSCLLNIDVGNK
jgi:hypothetical protein